VIILSKEENWEKHEAEYPPPSSPSVVLPLLSLVFVWMVLYLGWVTRHLQNVKTCRGCCPLCLIKCYDIKAYWRSGDSSRIPNLGSRYRWWFTFTLWPLNLLKFGPWIHWIGVWLCHLAGLDVVEKENPSLLLGIELDYSRYLSSGI
jgi:hypothetical protein